ncbi:flippase [Edwardsiella tarda]
MLYVLIFLIYRVGWEIISIYDKIEGVIWISLYGYKYYCAIFWERKLDIISKIRLILSNKDIKPLLFNSGWLLLDKMFRLLFGIFIGAWVARYLGPMKYGELAYVLAIISFFQVVALLGLDGIIVRDITNNKKASNIILGTAFRLRLWVGVGCFLGIILYVYLTNGHDSDIVWMTVFASVGLIFQTVDTIDLWFQSKSKSKITVISKLTAYTASNIFKVFLIINNASVIFFALAVGLDYIISAAFLTIGYKLYPTERKWEYNRVVAVNLIKESWPFIISGLSVIVYIRIDQIMIKSLLGDKELGVYAAIQPLSSVWAFVPTTIYLSLAPYITNIKKNKSHQEYMNAIGKVFSLFACVGWLIALCIFIFSKPVVNILLGNGYSTGYMPLVIHGFANLFVCLGVAQGVWILNEKKAKITLYRTIIGAITCILLNIILIPRMGISGAALTYLISQAIATTFTNIFFAKEIFLMQIKSISFFWIFSQWRGSGLSKSNK